MSALERPRLARPFPSGRLQPLENGERLTAPEFMRRYEAMPEVKKAELIEGIGSHYNHGRLAIFQAPPACGSTPHRFNLFAMRHLLIMLAQRVLAKVVL